LGGAIIVDGDTLPAPATNALPVLPVVRTEGSGEAMINAGTLQPETGARRNELRRNRTNRQDRLRPPDSTAIGRVNETELAATRPTDVRDEKRNRQPAATN